MRLNNTPQPPIQIRGGSRKTRRAHLTKTLACLFALILLPAIISTPTEMLAQTPESEDLLRKSLPAVEEGKPMLLQADEVIYDNQNDRVTAKGNVEIYYNDYTLLADKVIYNQRINTLAAEGNVRIKEPNGAVINADRITLTDDFRDGFIRSLKIVTADDARIAAERATRVGGDTTVFENGVFTPCKVCKENPEKPPLWRIKATKVIHKKAEGNIYYENAALEFLGVPIAYMPYFFHPDPSVKRRSGFLIPKFFQSKDLGTSLEIPYFFNLAPNYDFTFNPRYMSEQGVLWQGEWRHRTFNGAYNFKFAAIDPTNPDPDQPGNDDFRGTIETQGAFKLGSWWNMGWDITAETDDTMRRFYKLDNIIRTDRVSKVYVIGQSDRNYFEANVYHFGGLLTNDTSNAESIAHPIIDYNYIFDDPILGGELSFNSNILSLSREDGADTNRLITEVNWRKTLVDPLGQVYTPFASARGDIYKVSNSVDQITGEVGDQQTTLRGIAAAGVTYSYPFVAHTGGTSHIIEPVGQVIARPDTDNGVDIPNEDARSLVFDDTLLFDVDKFSGYDRIETGIRGNVGVRYTMQINSGGYARAVVGQSYQLDDINPFSSDSGLGTRQSDYVGGLYLEPNSNLSFVGQVRLDEDELDLRRTDLYMLMAYGPFNGSVNYANVKEQPTQGIFNFNEEIRGSAALRLTEFWSMFGSIRYDIEGDQIINDRLGLKYADECFMLAVSYNESFIRDRDIEPDQSITIQFVFKHLGGTSIKTGPIDDLIADSEDSKN